ARALWLEGARSASATSGSGAGGFHIAYLLGDGDGALGHGEMQPLDHAALDHDQALLLVLGLAEGVDDLPRPFDLLARRREDLVARPDLIGVDQCLAVHAKRATTLTLLAQAKLVLEVVIDAVDDVEAIGAGGDQRHGKPGHHGKAVMQSAGTRLLDQVIGAHDEAAEPVLGVD